ncbi:ATP-binding protein [Okeania sp.]|uniref:ATP-binding protein n=1 Tax=Okeania sp. TaxID=3100323 RepID=UPI002B4ACEAF|nr:ATP-binding protein [Okeania sp.]MEB3339276.1 ATP-binding protein [Okeania sp.]
MNYNQLINPYIFGKPIYEKEKLFGRENTIQEIQNNLENNVKITLLHVQRRIGKTSLITCLPQFFTEEENNYKFVTFSFQGHKDKPIPEILNYLADDIAATIDGLPKQVREEANSSYNFFQIFLPRIINEYLSGKTLVLLLDEFDVLEEDRTISDRGKKLFEELEKLVKQEEKLFAILVFGRPLNDVIYLEEFLQKKEQKTVEVGLLDKESTENLIVQPALGMLRYQPDAIDAIWQLSAGHPSITQLLCFNIFKYCREKKIRKVTDTHVSLIVNQAIAEGEALLNSFLEPLEDDEKLFFRAVAEIQESSGKNQLQTIIRSWQSIGKRLVEEYGFLAEKEDQTGYQIKVEFVQLWLIKFHPLSQEEKLQMQKFPEINNNNYEPKSAVNNHAQKPNQIYVFFSLLLVVGIFSVVIIQSLSGFKRPAICNDLLKQINSKISSGTLAERLAVINKFREKKNLDKKCSNSDEIYGNFYELLFMYGQEEIENKKFEVGIKNLCSISDEYSEKTQEYINTLIGSGSSLSREEKRKFIDQIIQQNQAENKCSAYSFDNEANKNNLFQQLQQIDKFYNEQGKQQSSNYNYSEAVTSYCKISKYYSQIPQIKQQLRDLYNDEFGGLILRKEKEEMINTLKKIGENNCPAFPDV